jgi:hypothetical protein
VEISIMSTAPGQNWRVMNLTFAITLYLLPPRAG